MTDLKELIEQKLDQYLEWPTADKSHVTTVSAKLFAEHVARLYADHIPDASKKVGRPQIREVFLRNGAVIPADHDDLPDYVYEAAFELLEMATPAVQGEPVAYQIREKGSDNWYAISASHYQYITSRKHDWGHAEVRELYAAPQPAEQPVSWIRISGDHVILSRCNWMYPASTEDSAGPRDEQRFAAVGRRDGDIVLPAPEGSLDREDLKTMLAWPSASKPAEQQQGGNA